MIMGIQEAKLTKEKIDTIIKHLSEIIEAASSEDTVPDVALIIHIPHKQGCEMFATGTMGPMLKEFLEFVVESLEREDKTTIQ